MHQWQRRVPLFVFFKIKCSNEYVGDGSVTGTKGEGGGGEKGEEGGKGWKEKEGKREVERREEYEEQIERKKTKQ